MKRKLIAALCLTLISATWITGCSGMTLSKNIVPSEKEVMKYVDELCPTEDVDYEVSTSTGKEYGQKVVTYEYSSNERDLNFEVMATCQSDTMFSWLWHTEIKDTYRQEIKKYYSDEIEDVFEAYDDSLDTSGYAKKLNSSDGLEYYIILKVDSYDQMVDVVDFCHELNMIYAQEKEFNTEDWMEENPLFQIEIRFENTSNNKSRSQYFEIDGSEDYDDTYETLMEDMYIQGVEDGKLIDDYVSDELL